MAYRYLWVDSLDMRWKGAAGIGAVRGTDDGGAAGSIEQLWREGETLGYIDGSNRPRMVTGNDFCAAYCSVDNESVNIGEDSGYDGVADSLIRTGANTTYENGHDTGVNITEDTTDNGINNTLEKADHNSAVDSVHDSVICPTHYAGVEYSADSGVNYGDNSGANALENTSNCTSNYTGVHAMGS